MPPYVPPDPIGPPIAYLEALADRLIARGLALTAGDAALARAHQGIRDLGAGAGPRVAVLGEVGVGKSALLNALMGRPLWPEDGATPVELACSRADAETLAWVGVDGTARTHGEPLDAATLAAALVAGRDPVTGSELARMAWRSPRALFPPRMTLIEPPSAIQADAASLLAIADAYLWLVPVRRHPDAAAREVLATLHAAGRPVVLVATQIDRETDTYEAGRLVLSRATKVAGHVAALGAEWPDCRACAVSALWGQAGFGTWDGIAWRDAGLEDLVAALWALVTTGREVGPLQRMHRLRCHVARAAAVPTAGTERAPDAVPLPDPARWAPLAALLARDLHDTGLEPAVAAAEALATALNRGDVPDPVDCAWREIIGRAIAPETAAMATLAAALPRGAATAVPAPPVPALPAPESYMSDGPSRGGWSWQRPAGPRTFQRDRWRQAAVGALLSARQAWRGDGQAWLAAARARAMAPSTHPLDAHERRAALADLDRTLGHWVAAVPGYEAVAAAEPLPASRADLAALALQPLLAAWAETTFHLELATTLGPDAESSLVLVGPDRAALLRFVGLVAHDLAIAADLAALDPAKTLLLGGARGPADALRALPDLRWAVVIPAAPDNFDGTVVWVGTPDSVSTAPGAGGILVCGDGGLLGPADLLAMASPPPGWRYFVHEDYDARFTTLLRLLSDGTSDLVARWEAAGLSFNPPLDPGFLDRVARGNQAAGGFVNPFIPRVS